MCVLIVVYLGDLGVPRQTCCMAFVKKTFIKPHKTHLSLWFLPGKNIFSSFHAFPTEF